MKVLKLIFMGTPAFALPSLELLFNSVHHLDALVTPPDRPCGRGRKLGLSPTKQWAVKHGIEVIQPEKITENAFMSWLEEKEPDLIVTVAFGRILSSKLLKLPAHGSINLHASYLPALRGAAPIHRAVIEGADYSGASIIAMSPELDAGDILMQEKEMISSFDTAGDLHDRLAVRGAGLLLKAVDTIAGGNAVYRPQDVSRVSYAPPLGPDDEELDWTCSATEIYNRIRGLNPWPGAYTSFRGRRLKVWKAGRPEPAESSVNQTPPGTILAVEDNSLTVATGDGQLTLLDLQPAGKKTMDAGSFCCGYRVEAGSCFNGG